MCGGFFSMAARSDWGVSPLRVCTRICGAASPFASAMAQISESGVTRFFAMSTASAFSGET